MYWGLVCVCYSLVIETTSVFSSKQCSCRGLRTILRCHWCFHEEWLENGCFSSFFFPLSGAGLWDTVPTDEKVRWGDGKPEKSSIQNCSPRLVGIKMSETCWFNLNFLTSSPGVGCFVYSNHMSSIWCYTYVLAFCCPWSSCHGQFSQFISDMNNASLRNHHYLFESAMLIQTGLDLFKNMIVYSHFFC